MKGTSCIRTLLIALLLMMPSLLWAQGTIQLQSRVELEVIKTNEQGEKVTVLIPADKVLPGETLVFTNTVTNSGANFVEYSNANLVMRKDWTLVDDVLRITMQVTPNPGNGETSVVETRLDFAAESRVFSHWFQPETGSHPSFKSASAM